MAFLDDIKSFVEEKPYIAIGAVVGGAAIVMFGLRSRQTNTDTAETEESVGTGFAAPAGTGVNGSWAANMPGTFPPVLVNQPVTSPSTPIDSTNGGRPAAAFFELISGGCERMEQKASGTIVCIPKASSPYKRIELRQSGTIVRTPR